MMLGIIMFSFALASAALAEPAKLDTKTYCTNGQALMWQPKGYLVPAPAMMIERELIVEDKILVAYPCPGFSDVLPIIECPSLKACNKAQIGKLVPGARWFVPKMTLEREMLGLDVR